MANYQDDFNKQVDTSRQKFVEYVLVKDKTGKKKYQKKGEDLGECELIQGKSHSLYFDTMFEFQNEALEARYQKFKEHRDRELQQQPDPSAEFKASLN